MEKQFIDQISGALQFFTETRNGYKFQCPYCQHGNKDHKGRAMSLGRVKGSLYRVNGRKDWKYRCFKCGEHKSFHHFLEDHFPKHFEAYVRQRDALGTTGKQSNCPTLETVLKRQGVLPEGALEFHKHRPLPAPKKPYEGAVEDLQQSPQVNAVPPASKLTKLPPMRSPQQQAGHQAKINRQMNQRHIRRRKQTGEL